MPNPFFYGGPITEPQKFFGRKREFRVIFGRLSTTPPQSVSVVGERRIGRTSLLYHLTQVYSQWLTDAERYLFAYVDLQSARCHTRAGLLAKMLEALLQQARLDRRSDDGQWLTHLRERISEGEAIDLPCFGEALERIKALGYRSVICLDEFEKLTARPQEFGDDLLDSWRNMAQFGHIAFITASKVPLELLSRTGRLTSPFFNIFAQVPLGELELDEARELITQPSDRPFTQVARSEAELAWLPDDPGTLPRGAHEALRRAEEASQSVAAALESTSRYRRVMGLERARARLDELRQSLAYADQRVAGRLGPVAEGWREVINAELLRLAIEEEAAIEIPQVYIAGPPVPGEEERLFVGREDLFRTLLDLLTSPHRCPPLMLYGQRRTGKTSLLLQLPRRLGPDIVPIFVDMQGAANVEGPAGPLYNLARAIMEEARRGRRLELPPITLQELAAEPFIVFGQWLDRVEEALDDRLVLLSLDEFEKIEECIERIGTGFLDFLRHLIQHRPRFVLLLSGTHTLEEMGQRWSTYFINVQPLKVSYLKEDEARSLITNPIDDFPLNYEPAAVEHIIAATRCQPFLVQLTCQELVNHLNSQRRRNASVADVEAALEEASVRGEFHFAEIWNTADAVERQVLSAVSRWEDRPPTLGQLRRRIRLEEADLKSALVRLCRRDLLELQDEGYRFQVELVRRWWRRR